MANDQPAPEKKKKELPPKRPSALKRKLQSDKKRLANRSFRSEVLTSIRTFKASLTTPEAAKEKLNHVYSLMDKGVKRGVYGQQKAARTKSRLSALLSR